MIRLPAYGTLGDIYVPVSIQIAVRASDLTIVIVLVGLERTLNDTTFWQGTTVDSSEQARHGKAQAKDRMQVGVTQSRVSHIQFIRDERLSFDEVTV